MMGVVSVSATGRLINSIAAKGRIPLYQIGIAHQFKRQRKSNSRKQSKETVSLEVSLCTGKYAKMYQNNSYYEFRNSLFETISVMQQYNTSGKHFKFPLNYNDNYCVV